MFKKLLSNLPFNPSLIGQVSFYARRIHKEASIRRTGLIILAVAVGIQVFAVITPPQSSLATSSNDLITGGFATKDQAVTACQQNIRSYKTILANYNITCPDITNASTVTLKSTDYNKQLYSMGHLAYGKKGETPIDIAGVGTVYMRFLWSWDTAGVSTYKALQVKTSDGKSYFILYNCGNLVSVGLPVAYVKPTPKPTTPTPKPTTCQNNSKLPDCAKPCQYNSLLPASSNDCKPCTAAQTPDDLTACIEYHKIVSNLTQGIKDANNTTAHADDKLRYVLTATNHGKATIKNFVITENINDVLDYATVTNPNLASITDHGVISWPATDIKPGASLTQTFDVQIKNPIPSTPVSSSDPGHYDLTMTNVYGNTTTVTLPPSVVKTTEAAVTKLPNTGPGTSLIVSFVLITFVGYLFARSRLMAKELDIVRSDFGGTGGGHTS